MKRVVLAAMVFFLFGGLAMAKDYEVTKKAGDYGVVVTIDKNPPTTGDNNLSVSVKDGAGAVVLRRVPPEKDAILACKLGADGSYMDLLRIPAGGSALPLTHDLLEARENCIKMSGREVFKLAVNAMADTSEQVLRQSGVPLDHIRWLVPHQANNRIIQAVGKRLGIPDDRVYTNLQRYGNTSAASIPIAVDELVRGHLVKPGDHLLMTAFGGGLTWGSMLVRW